VHEAIAYFYDHAAEIEAELQANSEPATWSELKKRLALE
jgi:hypothetical protein